LLKEDFVGFVYLGFAKAVEVDHVVRDTAGLDVVEGMFFFGSFDWR